LSLEGSREAVILCAVGGLNQRKASAEVDLWAMNSLSETGTTDVERLT
jgi:hypothetical protein